MHETRTVTRFMMMVSRRARRREGVRSTQRPKALEKSRTHTVSAMPLQLEVSNEADRFIVRTSCDAHFMEEAVKFPGKAAWINRIWDIIISHAVFAHTEGAGLPHRTHTSSSSTLIGNEQDIDSRPDVSSRPRIGRHGYQRHDRHRYPSPAQRNNRSGTGRCLGRCPA